MRATEVSRNLPLFAESLANISYIDLEDAKKVGIRQFRGGPEMGIYFTTGETQGVHEVHLLSDLENLRYVAGPLGGEILVADASSSIESMIRDDIRISLGALGRIAEYADDLTRKERRAVGGPVKTLGCITIRECLRNLKDDDIAPKIDSYETVLPILDRTQRNQVRAILDSPGVQESEHGGETIHIPKSLWVEERDHAVIRSMARVYLTPEELEKCRPTPPELRKL